MLQFAIVLLALLLVFTTAKWLLLRREVGRITRKIGQIHEKSTNERITVSTQDRGIAELANAVNALYADIYRERGDHRAAMEEMRRSMANISHDLRTPLTSIIGYVQLLRADSTTPEQARRYLAIVHDKSAALGRLVSSLFELARLEAGAYPFEMGVIDAGEILSEELAGFYDALTAGGEDPVIALDNGLWVIADKAALSRVFSNLMQNMVKYGGGGVRIAGAREEGAVVLRFSNRAEGMADEDVAQLFQRFFTADRMRSGESTGLGLSIVKEFVEQMDGAITASLEQGVLTFALAWRSARPIKGR